MNWIIIGILATAIVTLTGIAIKVAKKEDEMLADMNRRLKELEMNKEG